MWGITNRSSSECKAVTDALEHAAGRAGQFFTAAAVVRELPPAAREHLNSCEECRAFAEVPLVIQHAIHQRRDFPAQKIARAVGGAVVHHEDFLVGIGGGAHCCNDLADGESFIIAGYDDGELQGLDPYGISSSDRPKIVASSAA